MEIHSVIVLAPCLYYLCGRTAASMNQGFGASVWFSIRRNLAQLWLYQSLFTLEWQSQTRILGPGIFVRFSHGRTQCRRACHVPPFPLRSCDGIRDSGTWGLRMVPERKRLCTIAAIPVPVSFAVAERNQQIMTLESLYASGREEPKQGHGRHHTLSILC